MPRGVKATTKEVDEQDIIDLGEEVGTPNIIIDEEFGISGQSGDYALVQKKYSTRKGTEEDGINKDKTIRYINWTVVPTYKYGNSPYDILNNYMKYTTLTKIKSLRKGTFKDVEAIIKNQHRLIALCIKEMRPDHQIKEYSDVLQETIKLKEQLEEAKSVIKEAEKLKQLIRDKRAIIIKDTEPKKHRMPKEVE